MTVRRALLSTYDKRGLPEFAGGLVSCGVELLASGGTAGVMREAGLPVTPLEELTARLDVVLFDFFGDSALNLFVDVEAQEVGSCRGHDVSLLCVCYPKAVPYLYKTSAQENNPACAIFGQEISLIHHAVLDQGCSNGHR